MIIRWKKTHPDAECPFRASDGAGGYDLKAVSVTREEHRLNSYDTGVSLEIPVGYVGLVYPRSSIIYTGERSANGVGVIDPDYRGSITFKTDLMVDPPKREYYKVGDRVAQLLIVKTEEVRRWIEVDELTPTARGTGGYGSTGK